MDDGGDVECHAAMGAGAYRLFLSLLLGTTLEIFLHDSIAFFCRPSAIERSLTNIVRRCGLGGTSQLSRAFRARFGMPPRQYLAPVRQQDLDWHEARLITDGFDQDAFLWRQQRLGASAAHGTWHAPVPKQPGDPD